MAVNQLILCQSCIHIQFRCIKICYFYHLCHFIPLPHLLISVCSLSHPILRCHFRSFYAFGCFLICFSLHPDFWPRFGFTVDFLGQFGFPCNQFIFPFVFRAWSGFPYGFWYLHLFQTGLYGKNILSRPVFPCFPSYLTWKTIGNGSQEHFFFSETRITGKNGSHRQLFPL